VIEVSFSLLAVSPSVSVELTDENNILLRDQAACCNGIVGLTNLDSAFNVNAAVDVITKEQLLMNNATCRYLSLLGMPACLHLFCSISILFMHT
jgi:hypothetical protein